MAQFDPNNLDQNVVNLAKAMRQVESGNRAVLPAEGSKLGGASRYQYTTNTWKGVAQKYLGNANAPMTAKNEDQATYLRVKEWKDSGKSPKQIASMWNAGEGEPDAYTGKFKDGRPSVGTNSYGVKYNVPNHTKKVYNEFVKLSKANPPNKTKIQMAGQEEQDPGLLKSLGGALISSEKGFGESLGFGAAAGEGKAANIIRGITALPTKAASTIMNKFSGFGAGSDKYASAEQTREAINQAQESQNKLDDIDLRLGQAIIREKKLGKDTSKLESIWKQHTGSNFDLSKITGGVIDKTAGQVYGEGLGVGLDIATAGTYGKAASAPKMTGTLLTKSNTAANLAGKIGVRSAMPVANKVVTPTIVAQSANLLKTLPSVGKPLPKFGTVVKEGAKAVGTGAGIGYGYDVSMGLQEGETKEAFRPGLGTAIGAAIPGLGAGYKVAKFGGRKAAPKFINSLIGANATFNKAVGRGINPGETVAKYGITANDLEDLVNKTSQARKEVGEILGNTYKLPENAAKTADYSDVIKVIDNELGSIKFEESNASYVEKLQRAKRDILKNYPNLNSLTPEQAHQLKQDLASLRGFDFSQSKNNEFNNVVNGMYGRVTEKVNTLVPELASLNDDFSGLIAAEQSAATREQRNLGKNIISISGKFGMMGGAVGTGVGLATGGIGFLPLIAGAVGAGLEKILASTAVKTRFAKFLSGATNAEKQALLRGKTLVDQRAILAAAKDLGFEFEKEVTQNASKGPFLPPPKEAPPYYWER